MPPKKGPFFTACNARHAQLKKATRLRVQKYRQRKKALREKERVDNEAVAQSRSQQTGTSLSHVYAITSNSQPILETETVLSLQSHYNEFCNALVWPGQRSSKWYQNVCSMKDGATQQQKSLSGCSMKDGATQQQKSLSGDSSIPSIVSSTLTMTETTQSYASEDVLGLSECKDQRGNSNKSCQPDNEKEYSEVVQAERELCKLSFRNPGKFMEDFDPAKSDRELRKLKRRIHKEKVKRNQMYDEFGLLLENSENRCDCLELDCPGCHFPCPKCSSPKCGPVCRNNRCWIYETVEIEGSDKTLSWPS